MQVFALAIHSDLSEDVRHPDMFLIFEAYQDV